MTPKTLNAHAQIRYASGTGAAENVSQYIGIRRIIFLSVFSRFFEFIKKPLFSLALFDITSIMPKKEGLLYNITDLNLQLP